MGFETLKSECRLATTQSNLGEFLPDDVTKRQCRAACVDLHAKGRCDGLRFTPREVGSDKGECLLSREAASVITHTPGGLGDNSITEVFVRDDGEYTPVPPRLYEKCRRGARVARETPERAHPAQVLAWEDMALLAGLALAYVLSDLASRHAA
jgi:hypothetical protein